MSSRSIGLLVAAALTLASGVSAGQHTITQSNKSFDPREISIPGSCRGSPLFFPKRKTGRSRTWSGAGFRAMSENSIPQSPHTAGRCHRVIAPGSNHSVCRTGSMSGWRYGLRAHGLREV